MEAFPGNSKRLTGGREKPPEKKVEKVITGEVVVRKKSVGKRFKDVFFGGDFKDSMRYTAADVILPRLRNLVLDAGFSALERMLFGGSSVSRRRPTEYRPRTQYNAPISRIHDPRDPRPDRVMLPDQPPHLVRRSRRDVSDFALYSREQAELVLERLVDIIDKYDVASVADFYELCGQPTSYIDNDWGWSYLNNVEVRQVREGYLIDLPPAEPIK
jgi:hypothetical protein